MSRGAPLATPHARGYASAGPRDAMPSLHDPVLGAATAPSVLDPDRVRRARQHAEEVLQASLRNVSAAPAFQPAQTPDSFRVHSHVSHTSHASPQRDSGGEDSHQARVTRAIDMQSAALVTLSDKNTQLRQQLRQAEQEAHEARAAAAETERTVRAEAARRVEEASAQHASALADAKERAAAAEGRAASSERRNEELEGRRRELDSKVESLSAELRDAREQASSQRATVHELQAALAQREDALADATARIRSAEGELNSSRAGLRAKEDAEARLEHSEHGVRSLRSRLREAEEEADHLRRLLSAAQRDAEDARSRTDAMARQRDDALHYADEREDWASQAAQEAQELRRRLEAEQAEAAAARAELASEMRAQDAHTMGMEALLRTAREELALAYENSSTRRSQDSMHGDPLGGAERERRLAEGALDRIGHELWPLAPDVGWWDRPDTERASGYDALVQLAALVRARVSVLRDAIREHQADLRRALQ